jgi:glycosyltransferase involved in cell wall biosynthesis
MTVAVPAAAKMTVALVTETFSPELNGVAVTVAALVRACLSRGIAVQLIHPRQRQAPAHDPALTVLLCTGITIPWYQQLRFGLPCRAALRTLWQHTRPDVVYVATEGPLGWSALGLARQMGMPVLSGFHTNFDHYSSYYGLGWGRQLIASYLRAFHNRSAVTLVPTAETGRRLQAAGFSNVRTMPRGVDAQGFNPTRRCADLRASWGAEAETLVLLYVGRIAAEKNLSLVLSAYQAVLQRRPSTKLVLVGDGPLLASWRRNYPMLIYCGAQHGEALAQHYASADVFLFPSITETFGNVTLEAMASGLAVVAYDYAGAHEHISHGVNGMMAPLGDAAAYVAAVGALVDAGPAQVHAVGLAARASIEPFDWPQIYAQLEALFAEYARPPAD